MKPTGLKFGNPVGMGLFIDMVGATLAGISCAEHDDRSKGHQQADEAFSRTLGKVFRHFNRNRQIIAVALSALFALFELIVFKIKLPNA